jgi:hypothetical protein
VPKKKVPIANPIATVGIPNPHPHPMFVWIHTKTEEAISAPMLIEK